MKSSLGPICKKVNLSKSSFALIWEIQFGPKCKKLEKQKPEFCKFQFRLDLGNPVSAKMPKQGRDQKVNLANSSFALIWEIQCQAKCNKLDKQKPEFCKFQFRLDLGNPVSSKMPKQRKDKKVNLANSSFALIWEIQCGPICPKRERTKKSTPQS